MASVSLQRINRFIEQLFNVKAGPVLLDVEPSVRLQVPIISGVENAYLQGWNRWAQTVLVGPTAANQSGARIRNPSTSGAIAILEQIWFGLAGTPTSDRFDVRIGLASADLATVSSPAKALDSRQKSSAPQLVVSFQSSSVSVPVLTAPASTIVSAFIVINSTFKCIDTVDVEIPLLPGDAVQIVGVTVNESITCSFVWRERVLESSELV